MFSRLTDGANPPCGCRSGTTLNLKHAKHENNLKRILDSMVRFTDSQIVITSAGSKYLLPLKSRWGISPGWTYPQPPVFAIASALKSCSSLRSISRLYGRLFSLFLLFPRYLYHFPTFLCLHHGIMNMRSFYY